MSDYESRFYDCLSENETLKSELESLRAEVVSLKEELATLKTKDDPFVYVSLNSSGGIAYLQYAPDVDLIPLYRKGE